VSLAKHLKAHLPEHKSLISDAEFLLLDRKEYHHSQISPVHANLQMLGMKVGYPYRVLMSFLDQICAGLVRGDFNLVISDPSLTVAGYYCWMRAGGGDGKGRVYAPKGLPRMGQQRGLAAELLRDFESMAEALPNSKPDEARRELFTIVLGNTKNAAQTIFAVDRFAEAKQGLLVLKDYARVDAADEREYLESKRIFPAVTFEGHAFALKT